MSVTKYSPELEFLKDGPWGEIYILAEYWKSDLEFYRDDLRFLHHLLATYFKWIRKQENVVVVADLRAKLPDMNAKAKDLLEKTGKHRIQLRSLMVETSKANADIIKTEHGLLEEELAEFVKLFREYRKKVLDIIKYVIDSEHLEGAMAAK